MKKAVVVSVALSSLLALSACTTTQQTASVGGVAGAAIGGIATDSWVGAAAGGVVGAAAGAIAGQLLGQVAGQPDQCHWLDPNTGNRYIAPCP